MNCEPVLAGFRGEEINDKLSIYCGIFFVVVLRAACVVARGLCLGSGRRSESGHTDHVALGPNVLTSSQIFSPSGPPTLSISAYYFAQIKSSNASTNACKRED